MPKLILTALMLLSTSGVAVAQPADEVIGIEHPNYRIGQDRSGFVPPDTSEPVSGWHEPTDHEHGNRPPQWVLDSPFPPTFGIDPLGRASEHHNGFKSYHTFFSGGEQYLDFHMLAFPKAHHVPLHSLKFWQLAPSGDVSFIQGWVDFSLDDPAAPNVHCRNSSYTDERPIMLVNCEGAPALFETWYGTMRSGFGLDVGFSISPTFYAGPEEGLLYDPDEPDSWVFIELGLTRRVEFAWYEARTFNSKVPIGEVFCTNQLRFNGNAATLDCSTPGSLVQYIANDFYEIAFPDNAAQEAFACPLCQPPN